MNIFAIIQAIIRTLTRFSHYISAFLLYPIMVLIILLDVGGRFLFNSPFSWATEGSGLVQIMAIFLACAAVQNSDEHIRLDILYETFKPRVKILVNMLTSIVAGFWAGVLTWRSYVEIFVSYDMVEAGMDIPIPFWPIRIVMTFAFFLLVLELTMSFIINLGKLFQPQEEEQHV